MLWTLAQFMHPGTLLTAAACAAGSVAFMWLVVAKPVTRVCRTCGVETPCPFWLGWILLLRPGAWWRERILDRSGIQRGEAVLEVGCGVGVFTARAAERIGDRGRLVAIDIQHQMVAASRRRVRDAGDNVSIEQADVRTLPFADNTFDRVLMVSAFPEIPDKRDALTEIRRVLKPGGVLSVSEEFFDPDMYFPKRTRAMIEPHGYTTLAQHGSGWTMYTINFCTMNETEAPE